MAAIPSVDLSTLLHRPMYWMYSMPHPLRLRTLTQLKEVLGESFIVFCGSAVSAFQPRLKSPITFLPMTDQVMMSLFRQVQNRFLHGRCEQQIIASYSESILRGRYASLRQQTKFEDFLWRLEQALRSKSHVEDLLTALYLCERDQFTANHSAIAFLLRKRRASACLTTNFDNALELAYPGFQKFVHPNFPTQTGSPYILKLHGDVITGNYVATMPALLRAVQSAEHKYLGPLLMGQNVLVIGYSGHGDVDIAPQLSSSGANFVWTTWDTNPPPFAKYCIRYDLSSDDPDSNFLLGLASHYGWRGVETNSRPDWDDRLSRWVRNLTDKSLRDTVYQFFYGGAGWPMLHLHHIEADLDGTPSRNDRRLMMSKGVACLQVSAYSSAETALQNTSVHPEEQAQLLMWKGFTKWRLGKLQTALDILSEVAFCDPSQFAGQDQALSDSRRMYLEVARDVLRGLRPTERKKFWETQRLDEALNLLSDREQHDFRSYLLCKIVAFDLGHLLGKPVSRGDLERIFSNCYDLQLWSAAEAAARTLATIDRTAGLMALIKVDRKLARQGGWNTIRKSIATAIYVLVPGRWSVILDVLDGHYLGSQKARWVEWRYERKQRKWRKADPIRMIRE